MTFHPYICVWLFLFLSASIVTFIYFLSRLRSKRNITPQKDTSYECGFDPIQQGEQHFNVRFYIVGVLFVIFDLELAFLFPWAVVFDSIGAYGFLSMFMFLGFLVAGFVYEWKKGVLDWI